MGELDVRACVCCREVEQALRHPPGHVEEDQVLDPPRASITTWVSSSAITVAERRVVEERELPEHRAVPFDGDHDLVALLIGYRDLHRSRDDHVKLLSRIVAMEHDLIA